MSKLVPCLCLDKKQLKTHAGGGGILRSSPPAPPSPGEMGALSVVPCGVQSPVTSGCWSPPSYRGGREAGITWYVCFPDSLCSFFSCAVLNVKMMMEVLHHCKCLAFLLSPVCTGRSH